jgi:uncharacterized protein (DUF1778 family)
MARTQTKSTRLEARIAPKALAVVKRAAEIQGRSLSDFVVAAAQEVAHRTITEAQIIQLSLADQEKVFKALLNPPKPNAALKRAFQAHRELIRDKR